MKKKVILCFCLLLIIIAVILGVCIYQRSDRQSKTGNEPFTEQVKEVMIGIYGEDYVYSIADVYEVISSDKYEKASVKKRAKMLKKLLKKMKKNGQIKDYSFTLDSHLPSVFITNNDDIGISISLDDFPEGLNGLK